MTAKDFSEEFDLLLAQRVKGNNLIQFDEYEKSLLLTKANEEIALKYYKVYETSEYARRVLSPIIETLQVDSLVSTNSNNITKDSTLKSLTTDKPSDLWFIIQEQLYGSSVITVQPIRYDEYNVQKKNPFRVPNDQEAWRLDFNDSGEQIELLVSVDTSDNIKYFCRYIRQPKAIILPNAVYRFDDEELSIRDLQTEQTSELSSLVHEEILNSAVTMAAQQISINK